MLKKCLRPCPGLSMYLSERINWMISSFPRWISKILFIFDSWDHFGSLGCIIGKCPFSYDSILFLGNVQHCSNKMPHLSITVTSRFERCLIIPIQVCFALNDCLWHWIIIICDKALYHCTDYTLPIILRCHSNCRFTNCVAKYLVL